jgi:hypothetical protein
MIRQNNKEIFECVCSDPRHILTIETEENDLEYSLLICSQPEILGGFWSRLKFLFGRKTVWDCTLIRYSDLERLRSLIDKALKR